MRCPLFRGSSGLPVVRMINFFHLLNQSSGKSSLARRSRSSELVVFRPPERALIHRSANFARHGQVPVVVTTGVLVPSTSFRASNKGASIIQTIILATNLMDDHGTENPTPYFNEITNFIDQKKRRKTIEEMRSLIVGCK
jgi:hypothetical protein